MIREDFNGTLFFGIIALICIHYTFKQIEDNENGRLEKKRFRIGFAIFFILISLTTSNKKEETIEFKDNQTENQNQVQTQEENNQIVNEISVVDFAKMSKFAVENWCEKYKINCTTTEEYSDTIPKDNVIKQSLDVGTKVKENDVIIIYYSLGKEPTPVKKEVKDTTTTTPKTNTSTNSTNKTTTTKKKTTTTKSTTDKTNCPDLLPNKALCMDGTYAYKKDRCADNYQGLCSGHGGVKQKLGRVK